MNCVNYKESWAPKNWCFWTVMLEKTLESPLDCKEIKPVSLKQNQSWIFIRRIDAEAEALIIWPPNVKNWLTGKDPDAGKRLKVGGEGDDRGWDRWMASPTHWAWVWVDGELVMDREAWRATVHGIAKSWMLLCDWTELIRTNCLNALKNDSFLFFP